MPTKADIIREFIHQNEYLHEFRLQKLVYLAELLSLRDHDDRISEFDIKPYMYGTYSEDLSDKLEELESEFDTKEDLQHGKVTTVFKKADTRPDLDQEARDIIQEANQIAGNHKSTYLGEWSKGTYLYNNTPYATPIDFADYVRGGKPGLEEDISVLQASQ